MAAAVRVIDGLGSPSQPPASQPSPHPPPHNPMMGPGPGPNQVSISGNPHCDPITQYSVDQPGKAYLNLVRHKHSYRKML